MTEQAELRKVLLDMGIYEDNTPKGDLETLRSSLNFFIGELHGMDPMLVPYNWVDPSTFSRCASLLSNCILVSLKLAIGGNRPNHSSLSHTCGQVQTQSAV